MRIAVIENDPLYVEQLGKYIKGCAKEEWEIHYFKDSTEFGKTKLDQYEIIVADFKLPDVSGLTLLKSVSEKSSADLALISIHSTFAEDEIKERIDDSISIIFDKQNTKSIIDWFHYVEAKLRIRKMVENEDDNLANLSLMANGHSVDIKNNVAIFGISKQVDSKNKEHLMKMFQKTEFRVVAYFLNGTKANSSQLSIIVQYYKIADENGGKLVFWNKKQDPFVAKLMHDCTLDRIIKSFDDLDNAINFVLDKSNWEEKKC